MISPETLAAYADGELSAADAADVEAAVNADPSLQARLEQLRAQRDLLSAHYDGVLDEPVPQHLHHMLSQAGAGAASSSPAGFSLASWLSEFANSVFATRLSGALTAAACLVVGVFVGGQVLSAPEPSGYRDEGGALYAQGELARVLNTAASGVQVNGRTPVMSFTSADGALCRAFVSASGSGLACRSGAGWRMEALELQPAGQTGEFRTASTALPDSVLMAVDRLMEGDVLDPEAERLALGAEPRD